MRNRIREWREIRGLTQEELAAAIVPQTSSVTISRLETGRMGLSQKWIVRISDALEVSAPDLIGADIEAPPEETFACGDEAHKYTPEKGSWLEDTRLKDHQFFYSITSHALSALNVPEGAVVIADFGADAVNDVRQSKNTSLVLLEWHYSEGDFSERILVPRQFIPPQIAIRNSDDLRVEPMIVDGTSVEIIAVIQTVIRDT